MAHSMEIKEKAVELRRAGYSIKEIARILSVAVSTSSVWLRAVAISREGKCRMQEQSSTYRYRMSLRWNQKRLEKSLLHQKKVQNILKKISFTNQINKLICAVLFWAEGSKKTNHVAFTNSDPKMISYFLSLLRQSYDLDENKFRVSVHLHEYHGLVETLNFWSKVTGVAKTRFIKP